MSNETVTYSLEAVLTRIEGKIDNLQKDVNQKFDKIDERLNKLEVGQAKLTEKVEGIGIAFELIKSLPLLIVTKRITRILPIVKTQISTSY